MVKNRITKGICILLTLVLMLGMISVANPAADAQIAESALPVEGSENTNFVAADARGLGEVRNVPTRTFSDDGGYVVLNDNFMNDNPVIYEWICDTLPMFVYNPEIDPPSNFGLQATANQVTARFQANGGTGQPPANIIINTNTAGTLIIPGRGNLVRTGHTFYGWRHATPGGVLYAPGARISIPAGRTGYFTFNAEWRPEPTLSVWMESWTAPNAPSSTSTVVMTNQSFWTPSSNQSWLTVSQSGSTLTLTTTSANPSANNRTARVTITAPNGAPTRWIQVTQLGVATVIPTGVTISGNTGGNMNINQTRQLTAHVTPTNATNQNVTWSSSNTTVATVSTAGLVTARAAGSATITATTVSGGRTASTTINVNAPTLNAPGQPSATNITQTSVTISWNAVAGATSYRLYRNNVFVTSLTGTSFTATGLTANTTHDFTVRTVNASGVMSGHSVARRVTTLPIRPTSVNVTGNTGAIAIGGTLTLTATVSPINASDRSVTWSSANTNIATVSATGVVTARAAGSVNITATTNMTNANGQRLSATSTVVVNAATLAAPGQPRATNITQTGVTISWNSVGATLYRLYRNNNIFHSEATTLSRNVTGLPPGTTHTFTVSAVNASGQVSARSPALSVLTIPANPGQPTVSNITQTGATVSWTPVHGATSYRIYRNGSLPITVMTTEHTFITLSPNTTYSFTVVAINSSGVSGPSTARTVTTLATPAPSLTLSHTNWTTGPASTTLQINVFSNSTWSVPASNATWLTIEEIRPANRTRNGSFVIRVDVNAEPQELRPSRSGVVTVNVPGGPERTINVVQSAGYIWHDAVENWGAFWPGNIEVSNQHIGDTSVGFAFESRVAEARNAWGSALGVSIGTGRTDSAQIRAFGGTRDEIMRFLGYTYLEWAGFAYHPTLTRAGTITAGGAERGIYRSSGYSRIFVVQQSTDALWSQRDINITRMVTAHELGHALGFWGHPAYADANRQDVMWYRAHENHILQPNEIRHLRQIYDRFR